MFVVPAPPAPVPAPFPPVAAASPELELDELPEPELPEPELPEPEDPELLEPEPYVVAPYTDMKKKLGVMDWNYIAVAACGISDVPPWDVVIVDEAQDFTANQVRTVLSHLAAPFSLTFVMDAMQRIYPRYFTWAEAGVTRFAKTYTLTRNYRNTRQIAAFARPLIEGLPLEDDGALPDLQACTKDGPLPVVIAGKYSAQIDFILARLLRTVDFGSESVIFLQPMGGAWFDYLRRRREQACRGRS